MSLLRWIDETAKINRGKLKVWKKPDIPGIASTKLSTKKNNETVGNKKYTGDLLAEVCLDMICNHLNKMFSGKDVCIPSKFMTAEKRTELTKQLQILRNNDALDNKAKKDVMLQITKNLAAGVEASAVASEILLSFPDKQFLEIAMLPENITLESIFASRNLPESWTFIKLCDLIGKNPKKFAKQLKAQPKLRSSLVKEIADSMQELLICRTPYSINDPELIVQYYKEGMLFDEHDQVSSSIEAHGKAGVFRVYPSHLGIIRHLVKKQIEADKIIYSNFLEQIHKYQQGQIHQNKLPQLPPIDHHPTNIQAISIAKTSRPYLIKILKTHPDKNVLKMCQNKHYPKWYIVRKIIEADNQSRNTFVDIPEKERAVLEWGNKHLPRNKPPVITEKNAHGNFTPHLSNYWYEESFNRASILFDLANTDQLLFKRKTTGTLKNTLSGLNAAKKTDYANRRNIEHEKKELLREGGILGLPRSSMLALIADHELLPVVKNLQQQAQAYSKKNPKRSPEQVAEYILKAANKKNLLTGLNPKIYDQEKLFYLIVPAVGFTEPNPSKKTTLAKSAKTSALHSHNPTAQHTDELPSTSITGAAVHGSVANQQPVFTKQLTRNKNPKTKTTTRARTPGPRPAHSILPKASQARPRANPARF